jgi:hypothetical protein
VIVAEGPKRVISDFQPTTRLLPALRAANGARVISVIGLGAPAPPPKA